MFNKLLNIYETQYDKFKKANKKRIKVKNMPEDLPIVSYLHEDYLPPMPPPESDEEAKLKPEATIAERVKSNPRKRKNKVTRLKILI